MTPTLDYVVWRGTGTGTGTGPSGGRDQHWQALQDVLDAAAAQGYRLARVHPLNPVGNILEFVKAPEPPPLMAIERKHRRRKPVEGEPAGDPSGDTGRILSLDPDYTLRFA